MKFLVENFIGVSWSILFMQTYDFKKSDILLVI